MINDIEDVPCLIPFTSAAKHHHTFLKDLKLEKGFVVVFDKSYNNYLQYLQWTSVDIYFVTRKKDNAIHKSIKEFYLDDKTNDAVLKDKVIVVEKDGRSIKIRRVAYWDSKKEKVFAFISNKMEITPDTIVDI